MFNWRIQPFFSSFFHLHPTLKNQMERILGLAHLCGKGWVGSEIRTSEGQTVRVRCLGDKVGKATLKWFGLVQEKAQSIFG